LALRWRDVDLARGTITVREAKTDAGVRTVNVVPILTDELTAYRARLNPTSDALVFGTTTGRPHAAGNVRRRVLDKAVEKADEKLAKNGHGLPAGLTPHSLRRTFARILFALGESPPYVAAQMGHTTPNLTLSIYARQRWTAVTASRTG
jgi:integrase